MPAKRQWNEPPLYRRGKYWWTYYYDAAGERQRVSTKCTDRQAAVARAKELQRDSAEPGREFARETVADALAAFLDAPVERSANTSTAYGQRAVNVSRLIGAVRLVDLGLQHIDLYVRARSQAAGKSTMRHELTVLWMALKHARKRGRAVASREMLAVELPGTITPKTRWLTPAEVFALMEELPPHRALWVQIAAWTGARKREVDSLRWEDVDRAGGTIRIRGTKGARDGLNLSDRVIPMPAAMQTWASAQPQTSGPLVRPVGTNITSLFRRACRDAGIEYCSPHDLRRTLASWLKQKGVDSLIVGKILGHADGRQVDRVYGKLNIESMRGAMKLI